METVSKTSLTEQTRKGACLAFFSAYQDMDTARMIQLATPDATVHFVPMGDDGKGSFWEFGKGIWQLLIDCFPDLDNTVDSLTTQDDTVVANVAIFGTQAQDFLGITNKGLRFNSDHVFIFRFNDDDRITHLDISWDHAGFSKQLGA
ncbi:nuclear transport factor 2 family protein [Spirosoma endbachense]|uniref:Nuclear transport factor 2 family protein n=1 Tax=Spirosoma endbachense TaxID=2666025 RepID=A0A6P1VVN9_9BACT|nr:nuclear transport factor 2 family protein [Spirosoma endbachense]QHV95729.1 nuclear transport factor 2 family protein [Spirosoma endbachense]